MEEATMEKIDEQKKEEKKIDDALLAEEQKEVDGKKDELNTLKEDISSTIA